MVLEIKRKSVLRGKQGLEIIEFEKVGVGKRFEVVKGFANLVETKTKKDAFKAFSLAQKQLDFKAKDRVKIPKLKDPKKLKKRSKPRARKVKAAGQFASIFVGGTRRVR